MPEENPSQNGPEKNPSQSGFLNKLGTFLSLPLVGSILGIVGVVLAFYFYFAGIHEPRLTYYVHPVRTPLVQVGKVTGLKVLFNGTSLEGNVTAAQIAIWNSGSAPILGGTDILELF